MLKLVRNLSFRAKGKVLFSTDIKSILQKVEQSLPKPTSTLTIGDHTVIVPMVTVHKLANMEQIMHDLSQEEEALYSQQNACVLDIPNKIDTLPEGSATVDRLAAYIQDDLQVKVLGVTENSHQTPANLPTYALGRSEESVPTVGSVAPTDFTISFSDFSKTKHIKFDQSVTHMGNVPKNCVLETCGDAMVYGTVAGDVIAGSEAKYSIDRTIYIRYFEATSISLHAVKIATSQYFDNSLRGCFGRSVYISAIMDKKKPPKARSGVTRVFAPSDCGNAEFCFDILPPESTLSSNS